MINPKVSVIVPVYNMEKTVAKCLESILGQSYSNIEVIIINDGSKDNTHSIIQHYADRDNRIIFISRENRGLSISLGEGVKQATGDFVIFVDSDDYIEQGMISSLIDHQKATDADMVQCGIAFRRVDGSLIKTLSSKNREIKNVNDLLKAYFVDNSINVTLAACLYRNTLFETVQFPPGALSPDLQTAPFLIVNCRIFVQIPDVFYNAVMYKNSVSRGNFSEKMYNDKIKYTELLEKFFIEHAPYYQDVLYFKKCSVAAYLYNKIKTSEGVVYDKTDNIIVCKRIFKENYPKLKSSPLWNSFNRKEKTKLVLFNIHPLVYVYFLKVYGKLIKTYNN